MRRKLNEAGVGATRCMVRLSVVSASVVSFWLVSGCTGTVGTSSPEPAPPMPSPDAEVRPDAALPDASLPEDAMVVQDAMLPPPDAEVWPENPFEDLPAIYTVEDGIGHVEGPTWVPEERGFVYHTRPNVHRLWRPGEDDTSRWYELPGGNHGSHYSEGFVYLANRRPAEIARIRVSDTRYESLDTDLDGKTLALPNDIDRFRDGSLFFTDWGGASTPGNYVGFGVYRLFLDGKVDRVLSDLGTPNGIAFTPDCRRLFVTDHPDVMAYRVADDGTLSDEQAFFRHRDYNGSPLNGIAVDLLGNLYTVGNRKITAVDPDGNVLGDFDVPGADPVNLAFGGIDRRMLLITTTDGVLAVQSGIPGGECHGLK
ncbi:MAG: SMP-30/gluconolactonase/LRE family protein [Myxococcota bacterium]